MQAHTLVDLLGRGYSRIVMVGEGGTDAPPSQLELWAIAANAKIAELEAQQGQVVEVDLEHRTPETCPLVDSQDYCSALPDKEQRCPDLRWIDGKCAETALGNCPLRKGPVTVREKVK